jgi:hypothetical protein
MGTYDPTWVVELFQEQLNLELPEGRLILENLKRCTEPVSYCSCGCGDPYFIVPKSPAWKFRGNITAYKDHTLVILDLMEDFSIGSIEIQRDMPFDIGDMRQVDID